jgi:hypothetical protein
MADLTETGATYESPREGLESPSSFVKLWLDALSRADEEEKEWRKAAEDTLEIYRGKQKSRGRKFNILHSNVETLCPALYNSTPIPDIRRRFSDPDPVAKSVSDLLERSLSFSVDAYDFDAVMKAVIKDGEIVGRGTPRVRYVPIFGPVKGPDGQPVVDPMTGQPQEEVVYEEVTCDYTPWRYFRRGPGRTWKDVSWIAFGDFMTKDDIIGLTHGAKDKSGNPLADAVPLNYTADTKDGAQKPGTEEQSIFQRALVWQIWDKDSRKVISICPDYQDAPLSLVPDPLGLIDFFPVPRPYQPVQSTDSLVPIVPYEIYQDLVEELNDITARINRLVKQLRPRGGYASTQHESLKAIAEADDGELVPLTGIEHLVGEGGLEKAIVWFPLDPTANALKVLLAQRAEVKQVIYEVTGIADILRGATDPNETLGAQQLKAQWGSLRIQDRQAECARVARDLFRLKSEIIATKFSWDTIMQMTGIKLPDQAERDGARQAIAAHAQQAQQPPPGQPAPGMPGMPAQPPAQPPPPLPPGLEEIANGPSREEVEAILRSDIVRRYRIDIESDSTIRGDLARNQQIMVQFVQGTAQYAQAMGPMVQMKPDLMPAVIQLYAAFARQFKLGKQAEDELEKLIDNASKPPPPPQPPPPDPRLPAIQAKAEADKFKSEADVAKTKLGMESATLDHQIKMTELGATQQANAENRAMERERMALQNGMLPIQ